MSVVAQYEIGTLLVHAGAHPRGNRHDCPRCGGIRTITHTEEVFYCHKCGWKGNVVSLAMDLGVYRRLPAAEYRELSRRREQAYEAARRLYAAVKARRFELLDLIHTLNHIEAGAHEAGPGHSDVWDALAVVYRERPALLAELLIFEESPATELLRLLCASPEERQREIDRVPTRGGLYDSAGRFVEIGL